MTNENEFTEDDRLELIRLLAKMASCMRSQADPEKHDFLPDGVFQILHGITSQWAPELVITRKGRSGLEVFLARYNGGAKEFDGIWNLPGGYNRFGEVDLNASVQRIAMREIGIGVGFSGVMDAEKWRPDDGHPYGRPLSLFVKCTSPSIPESDAARFFPVDSLPETLCGVHRRFISLTFR